MMVGVTDRELPVLAQGFGVGGEQWTLTTQLDRNRVRTMVQVVEPDGRRWGAGFGGRPVPPDRRVATFVGRSGESSHLVIVRVAPEVRAVRATLSDGTVDDLTLHGDIDQLGARIAVLVYPAPLDLHRLTLLDGRGQELPDVL
jgi:hypothetical protein